MSENKIELKLSAEDDASSVVHKFIETLGDSQLGRAISTASVAFLALDRAVQVVSGAVEKVADALGEAINAASQAEQADRKLASSLVLTGQYSKTTAESIGKLASRLQNTTGVSDETVKEMVSLGLSLGMTSEQAQKAAEAALNFSAATGQDANSSMRNLAMTLSGTSGRFGKMVQELGGLTETQLRNGAAIDVLAKKYQGFAQAQTQDFDGATKITKEGLGEVIEELGKFITQNSIVVSAITEAGQIFVKLAKNISDTRQFLEEHSGTIKNYAIALGIAVGVVGSYMAVTNAARIATTAWTVAQIALNTAMKLSPIGLVMLAIGGLTLAIGYLIDNFDKVSGAIKVGFGVALQLLTTQIRLLLQGLGAAVGVFNSDWGSALTGAAEKIDAYATGLQESGQAQMAAADAAKEHAKETENTSNALKGLEEKAQAANQKMIALTNAFFSAAEAAKPAIDAVKDFSPRIQLAQWEESRKQFETSLLNLQSKSKEIIVTLKTKQDRGETLSPDEQATLAKANEEQMRASEALKAVKIKNEQEVRSARIKEVEIALEHERSRTISISDEIMLKRIQAAEEIRNIQVQIATERILQEENIARHGIDVQTQAALAAREVQMNALQEQLEAERTLAVSAELQKQQELASARSKTVSGLGGPAKASAKGDEAILQEQARQAQLTLEYQKGYIDRENYRRAMLASEIAEQHAHNAQELAIAQQRAELLGLTELGLKERFKEEDMRFREEQKLIQETGDLEDAERKIALEEAEMTHQANMNMIREQMLEQDVQRQQRLRDTWGATLADIRLQQERHGTVMGTIQGIQHSSQFQALQTTLNETATMMQTGNKNQFEIGKAAAIASASVNTFLAATGALAALSSIPIVGPALGIAAAALITTAGILRINQIRSQKYTGKGQADEGIESVPRSMAGKSFILAHNERVIQSDQNKELGKAISRINSGHTSNENTVNINVNGNTDEGSLRSLRDTVVDVLRDATERGQPVINERGLVRT